LAEASYLHNSYLGLTLQVGIPAAVLFFFPLVGVFGVKLWTNRNAPPSDLSHALHAVLLCGLITFAFESWPYSAGNAFSFPFWVCVMLLIRGGDERAKSSAGRDAMPAATAPGSRA
jgi:O-antigen ligase